MAFTSKWASPAGAGAADGSSEANAWSHATMLTTAAAGQLVNYKGTPTRTTSLDTFTNAGTIANPICIRGYASTVGDLDVARTPGQALSTTGYPIWTYTTGNFTPKVGMIFLNIGVTSAITTAGAVAATALSCQFQRCVFTNTSASGQAVSGSAGFPLFWECDFFAPNATSNNTVNLASGCFDGCLITGNSAGGAGLMSLSGVNAQVFNCMLRDTLGNGIAASNTDGCALLGNSLGNIGGIAITNNMASSSMDIRNNVAWGTLGTGSMISQFYAGGSSAVHAFLRKNNCIGNMDVSDTNIGNWFVREEVTLTASPYTSSTDMSLNSNAGGGLLVRGAGYPPYFDGGAVQHKDSGGGGYLIGG